MHNPQIPPLTSLRLFFAMMVFAFLVPLAKNYKHLLCLFAFAASTVVTGMYFTPEAAIKGYWYVNPLTRLPDFIAGMLLFRLYEYFQTKDITLLQGSILEVLSVVFFLFLYLYASEVPKVYRYSCYYWLPVSLVLLSFSLQKGILSRLLSNRFLVKGGEISYSFYLIHLFVLLSYAEWQKTADMKIAWYVSIPILFIFIILLSLLSYQYFERPMNRKVKQLLG